MPFYNKIQVKYLLENLNSRPLPRKSDPKADTDFIKNFISVMEKIIGCTDFEKQIRKDYLETFINYLETDERLLSL